MSKLSEYAFVAGLLTTGLGIIAYLAYALSGIRAARVATQTAGGAAVQSSGGGLLSFSIGPRTASIGRYASIMAWLALSFLSAMLVFRTIATGHGPFANMYEFSIAFAWGILVTHVWFERRYHQRLMGLITLPVALVLMLYATTIPSTIEPLVPALQNNLLLTIHVAVAIIAYGSFTIAFGAAFLHLIQPEGGR